MAAKLVKESPTGEAVRPSRRVPVAACWRCRDAARRQRRPPRPAATADPPRTGRVRRRPRYTADRTRSPVESCRTWRCPASAWTAPAVRLSGLRGAPMLVNVWAQWCGPCRPRRRYLAAAAASGRVRLRIVGVDYADPRPDAAIEFAIESGSAATRTYRTRTRLLRPGAADRRAAGDRVRRPRTAASRTSTSARSRSRGPARAAGRGQARGDGCEPGRTAAAPTTSVARLAAIRWRSLGARRAARICPASCRRTTPRRSASPRC